MTKKKGFTLVELLVVIAILAILATVSIVGYTSFIQKANDSNALTETKQTYDLVYADLIGVVGQSDSTKKVSVQTTQQWEEFTGNTLTSGKTYSKKSDGSNPFTATTNATNVESQYDYKSETGDDGTWTSSTELKASGDHYYKKGESGTPTPTKLAKDTDISQKIYTYVQNDVTKYLVFSYNANTGLVTFACDATGSETITVNGTEYTNALDITDGMKATFTDLELAGKFYLVSSNTIIYVTENGKGTCTWQSGYQVK